MNNVAKLVNNNSLHEAAVVYADNGYKVFPLVVNGKEPLPKSRGFKDATDNLSVNNGIWGNRPDLNIGLPTGQVTGVFVVDIDVKNGKDGEKSLVELEREYGELPETLEQKTPSGGRHLFFKCPTDVRVSTRQDHVVGIDIRGDGGYVAVAPSSVDGVQYQFVNPDVDVAEAPGWLVTWINDRKAVSADVADSNEPVFKGSRNDRVFREAVKCRKDDMPYEEAKQAVASVNQSCVPPLPASEVQRTLDSAYRYEPGVEVPEEILEMNKKFAVVNAGGKCRVLEEKIDPLHGNKDFDLWQVTDFKQFYSNRYIKIDDKKRHLGSVWFDHPQRRGYAGIGFYPKGAPDDIYNIWGGFAVEPVEGDCSLFIEHVRENIASGDEHIYNYIIAWIADVIQNPDKLVGTALVLRGDQGVGKGVFANVLGSLFGRHYMELSQSNQLVGRFNGHFKDKVLLLVDEAFWGGDKKSEGTLKNMVTEPYITIEEKGLNAVTMKNHLHMIFSTNNEWAVPAGPQERRFFVVDVGDKRRQDRPYFGSIYKQMDNGGHEALLHYLQHYDLSGIDLGKFPQTEALWEQKMMSMSQVQKFWMHKLDTGQLDVELKSDPFGREVDEGWNDGEIECDRFYEQYKEFVSGLGNMYKPTPKELGTELRKLLPGKKLEKPRLRVNGIRTYAYRFPELDKCREHFCKLMNYEIEWPEVEESIEE